MIDGIKFEFEIEDINEFKKYLNISFTNDVDAATGEIKPNRFGTIISRGKLENYDINLKESRGRTFVHVKGSLHKNYQNGENYERFTFENMQDELMHIQDVFNVSLKAVRIKNIEIGVNLEVDFEPYDCLQKNLLSYKGKDFRSFSPNKIDASIIGFDCELSQYKLKIYDKGKQYKVKGKNLLRFEIKVFKMHCLKKYELQTLDDLTDEQKVLSLKQFLLDKLGQIIFDDAEISTEKLNAKQLSTLNQGRLKNSWSRIKKLSCCQMQRKRNRFNKIINVHGISYGQKLRKAINKEWNLVFDKSAMFLL